MASEKRRILWIDVAKGICMLAIIAGHFGIPEVTRVVFAFHIPVFFMLSGYTMSVEKSDKEFLQKRFTRLMKPYFITCVLITLLDIFNSAAVFNDNSIPTISDVIYKSMVRSFFGYGSITAFMGIDLGGYIGAIWFLPALFFASAFAKLILGRFKKWSYRAALAVILFYTAVVLAHFIWLPFSIQSGMMGAAFVILGKWMAEEDIMSKIRWYHLLIFAAFFAVGFHFGWSEIHIASGGMNDYFITPVIVVMASILVIRLSMLIEKSKFFGWVGRGSIIVLAVHTIQLDCLRGWFVILFGIWNIQENVYLQMLIYAVTALTALAVFDLVKLLMGKARDSWTKNDAAKKAEIEAADAAEKTEDDDKKKEKKVKKQDKKPVKQRDATVDIFKALLIIIMMVGHRNVLPGLRSVIYSFHMVAFVFLSGVFYKPREGGAKKLVLYLLRVIRKSLIPYIVFAIGYVLFKAADTEAGLRTVIFGMSFSNKFLTDVVSVGPVYFILMLVVIRIIYTVIGYFVKSDLKMSVIVFILSLTGLILGRTGFWLPWSADCALYAMIFYHIGYLCKKYKVLDFLKEHSYMYFLLAALWAFYRYTGAMELATRVYDPYGLVVIGVTAAILVVYMWMSYINNNANKVVKKILCMIGESTMYILIVHVLISGEIHQIMCRYMLGETMYDCVVHIILQIIIGVLINEIIKLTGKGIGKLTVAHNE